MLQIRLVLSNLLFDSIVALSYRSENKLLRSDLTTRSITTTETVCSNYNTPPKLEQTQAEKCI